MALKTYVESQPSEIFRVMEKSRCYPDLKAAGLGRFPMTEEMLLLLKKANPLPQEYHYIEDGERFAFFTVYENRMNLLTFGKASWYMRIKTIAYPCSLSCGGYLTNDLPMMLRYIKSLKGGKLILNVPTAISIKGMTCGETLPTCRLTLHAEHTSAEAYLNSLRSMYRRRMKLALKRCKDVSVREYATRFCEEKETAAIGSPECRPGEEHSQDKEIKTERKNNAPAEVYSLYCQTYEKSDYKLEKLESSFFEKTDAVKLVFFRNDKAVGFVMLKQKGDELIFLFCGMDYPAEKSNRSRVKKRSEEKRKESEPERKTGHDENNADLYYMMLYHIVKYGIEHHCKTIDFGQTSENTKLKFGAELEQRYFYAHHSNPLLNLVALVGKPVLEYKYRFPDYHVFKEL